MSAGENSLRNFAYTIAGSVDHAVLTPSNNGPLWERFGGSLDHVEYRAPAGALLPQGTTLADDEALTLTARDWHGRGKDQLAFWLKTQSRESWEMPSVGATYTADSVRAFLENDQIEEAEFLTYLESYMSDVPTIKHDIGLLGVAMAFRAGIDYIAETPLALNVIKMQVAEKIAGTQHCSNGWQLAASLTDTTDTEGTAQTAAVELDYFFTPLGDELPYGGRLIKKASVTIKDGEITDAKRESNVSLMDNPFVTNNNISAYSDGSPVDSARIPDVVKPHLYADESITDEDIAYFQKLILKPLTDKDISLF
ncbi:MAG: hypothetical protein ABI303_04405 [Candidatus Saccharimonas sp.]